MDTGPILSAQWLVRFRWAVAAGAAAMLLVGWIALGLRLDMRVVGATLALQVASNVWFAVQLRRRGRASPAPLGQIALLDVALLTAILSAERFWTRHALRATFFADDVHDAILSQSDAR